MMPISLSVSSVPLLKKFQTHIFPVGGDSVSKRVVKRSDDV